MAKVVRVGSDALHSAPAARHTHHAASAPAHRARIRHEASPASVAVLPAVQTSDSQSATTEDVAASHPATTTTVKQPATKQPPAKKHHKKKHHKKAPPKKPAAPKHAARTTPSAAAVASAVSGLKKYVHTILTPTATQVAEFGNDVCTAFDQNKTLSQVEATILQKVKSLPFTTVESGAASYVVKTAVHLYCPGYTSKLG
jgi:hypothetical protein